MVHPIQIFLLTLTLWVTQVWDCWAFWRLALHSEGRAPVTHGTSCLCKKQAHGQMQVTQYLMPNSVSKLKSLTVKTISEFWGFWKFAINANSFTFYCSEGASPAPDNVLNKCSGVQQAELGQNPALNSIQWDPSPLHCLWHFQRMHMCCYTLYQSAQSLGQNRRSTEAGTAWIFSFCSPVWAPLLLLPISSAPLVLFSSTEGRRLVGTCSLLHGAQSDREGQEEILL